MLKVGLRVIGADEWIGGLYYIHNLVRALRTLPGNEQPEIVLAFQAGTERKHYEEIEPLVELLPYASSKVSSVAPSLTHRAKQLLKHNRLILSLATSARQFLGGNPYRALEQALSNAHVSLVFPCTDSMGTDFRVPWLAWAWDFQHKHYPDFFSRYECQRRDQTFARLATDARLIVTSSNNALADFDRFFPGQNHKLRVLHFTTVAMPAWYERDVAQTCRKFDLPARYLMLPNQFWVHKNHRVAFEAIKILIERGLDVNLVCTGGTADYRHPGHFEQLCNYIKTHDLGDRIRILGLIPRYDQIQVMRGAMAVVQPSLFEGWSTVVEDARALGKRQFLSDIQVHVEQNPPNGVYFSPHSPEALARVIETAWDTLSPGPCLSDEQAALAAQDKLVTAYARTFLRIAQELVDMTDGV